MTIVAPAPAERLLYSVRDAARLLSISPRQVWRLIDQRAITPRRIGTRVVIPRDELDRFVAHLPTEVAR